MVIIEFRLSANIAESSVSVDPEALVEKGVLQVAFPGDLTLRR
jgi:hypothetical protein